MAKWLWHGLVALMLASLIYYQPQVHIDNAWLRTALDFPLFRWHGNIVTLSGFLGSSFMSVDGHEVKYGYLVLTALAIYLIEKRVSS